MKWKQAHALWSCGAPQQTGWPLISHGLFYRCSCYVSGPGNISVVLLSMQGLRALGFHQKYLNLCSEDEQRSYRFGTAWRWVINNRIFIFGWTIPLKENATVFPYSNMFFPQFRRVDMYLSRLSPCTIIVIIFIRLENRHVLFCVTILTRVTTHVNVFK